MLKNPHEFEAGDVVECDNLGIWLDADFRLSGVRVYEIVRPDVRGMATLRDLASGRTFELNAYNNRHFTPLDDADGRRSAEAAQVMSVPPHEDTGESQMESQTNTPDGSIEVDTGWMSEEVRLSARCTTDVKNVLACVLLSVDHEPGRRNLVTLRSTDLNLTYTREINLPPNPGIAPFKVAVKPELLADVLKHMPGLVRLSTVAEGPYTGDLMIRHEERLRDGPCESTVRLNSELISDFPPIWSTEPTRDDRMLSVEVRGLVDAIKWATASAHDKFGMAILVDADGKSMSLASTDGQTFSVYGGVPMHEAAAGAAGRKILMSRKFVAALLELLDKSTEERIDLRVRDELVTAAGVGWRLTVNAEGVEFPAGVWRVLQQQRTHFAAIPYQEFSEAFRAAARTVRRERGRVKLSVGAAGVTFHGDGFDREVACDVVGDELTIEVAPAVVDKWLSRVRGSKWVGFASSSPFMPTVFMSSDQPRALMVVSGLKRPAPPAPPAHVPGEEPAEVVEAAACG